MKNMLLLTFAALLVIGAMQPVRAMQERRELQNAIVQHTEAYGNRPPRAQRAGDLGQAFRTGLFLNARQMRQNWEAGRGKHLC